MNLYFQDTDKRFKLPGMVALHRIKAVIQNLTYFQVNYYIGYSDSSGVLIPHAPISIADINDNDNFHQLCFSTR